MNRRQFVPMLVIPGLFPCRGAAKSTDPDWPQWRGPNRDGLSSDTGLAASWPSGGPKSLWTVSGLGNGYGSISMVGDRLYLQGGRLRESVLFCLNRADGKTIWTTPLGQFLDQDRGPGPRGTPTVDGDRVYALSEDGDLSLPPGEGRLQRLASEHFEGVRRPESPLVTQRITAGGREDADRHARRRRSRNGGSG